MGHLQSSLLFPYSAQPVYDSSISSPLALLVRREGKEHIGGQAWHLQDLQGPPPEHSVMGRSLGYGCARGSREPRKGLGGLCQQEREGRRRQCPLGSWCETPEPLLSLCPRGHSGVMRTRMIMMGALVIREPPTHLLSSSPEPWRLVSDHEL